MIKQRDDGSNSTTVKGRNKDKIVDMKIWNMNPADTASFLVSAAKAGCQTNTEIITNILHIQPLTVARSLLGPMRSCG